MKGPVFEDLDESDIIAQLRINTRGVMMLHGDSFQLSVKAISMNDSEIPVPPGEVTWMSEDSLQVYVDQSGKIHARDTSEAGVRIMASYRYKYTTRVDTIPVYVSDDVIHATSIRMVLLDSNRVGAGTTELPRIRIDLYDNGNLIKAGVVIPVDVTAPADFFIASEGGDNGETVIKVLNDNSLIGRFWIKSTLNLFGNEVGDSVAMHGIYPAVGSAVLLLSGSDGSVQPQEMLPDVSAPYLQPCGLVFIANFHTVTVDVVFDDSASTSTDCSEVPDDFLMMNGVSPEYSFTDGNATAIPPFTFALRRSSTPGLRSFYVRDAVTKTRLPVSGRYQIMVAE